jgi:sRNA-binding regulator protein Hfq
MIEPGKHVKYFLRNGMVLEGIIEKDGGSEVVLQSLDGKSLMILHKPAEDIMMTKIILEEVADEPAPQEPAPVAQTTSNTPAQDPVSEKLQQVLQQDDPDLQKMSIEELRQLVMEQDRQLIANKKKEHFGTAGAAKMTKYSSPYSPMRTVGRKVIPRAAYYPGEIPAWAYGRPPRLKPGKGE